MSIRVAHSCSFLRHCPLFRVHSRTFYSSLYLSLMFCNVPFSELSVLAVVTTCPILFVFQFLNQYSLDWSDHRWLFIYWRSMANYLVIVRSRYNFESNNLPYLLYKFELFVIFNDYFMKQIMLSNEKDILALY